MIGLFQASTVGSTSRFAVILAPYALDAFCASGSLPPLNMHAPEILQGSYRAVPL